MGTKMGHFAVFWAICFISVLKLVSGMEADLYLNKDKFGEFYKMEISEKGCTNVPLNWENQAVSVDTHGSCLKFYDLPYCRGKFVALQPYHGTFQDNLQTLGFSKIISSASPCGPKVPTGRYYIQNGADGSVLTVEVKNNTPVVRAHDFKPYISKGQQFQLEKVSLADYEIIPRVNQNLNPLTFDMSISTTSHPVRRVWKIESVYRGRYLIKNEWNNRCLYKSDSGKVEEHECVSWSPNQEWIFRSIKVKPYFPSKEELKKNPLRPDDKMVFEPQDDAFSTIPYQPNHGYKFPSQLIPLPPGKRKKGGNQHPVQIQRPGPMIINPGEPFPPVFPFPILPKVTPITANTKKTANSPPVPQIRHPGPLPFPVEPVVLDPKKPTTSPLDAFNVFVNQQYQHAAAAANANRTEAKKPAENDEDNSDEEGQEDDQSEESQEQPEEDTEGRPRPGGGQGGYPPSDRSEEVREGRPRPQWGQGGYPPIGEDEQRRRPKPPGVHNRYPPRDGSEEKPGDELASPEEEYQRSEEFTEPAIRNKKRRKQEKLAGVKYSDYRLFF